MDRFRSGLVGSGLVWSSLSSSGCSKPSVHLTYQRHPTSFRLMASERLLEPTASPKPEVPSPIEGTMKGGEEVREVVVDRVFAKFSDVEESDEHREGARQDNLSAELSSTQIRCLVAAPSTGVSSNPKSNPTAAGGGGIGSGVRMTTSKIEQCVTMDDSPLTAQPSSIPFTATSSSTSTGRVEAVAAVAVANDSNDAMNYSDEGEEEGKGDDAGSTDDESVVGEGWAYGVEVGTDVVQEFRRVPCRCRDMNRSNRWFTMNGNATTPEHRVKANGSTTWCWFFNDPCI